MTRVIRCDRCGKHVPTTEYFTVEVVKIADDKENYETGFDLCAGCRSALHEFVETAP